MPERGGPTTGRLPEEELAAEGLLDAVELGRQGRLRHPQLSGRLAHAAGVGDGAQGAKMPYLKLHARSINAQARLTPDSQGGPNSGASPARWSMVIKGIDPRYRHLASPPHG
ncbi:hypothetical protein GCM10010341_02590 [Streptomyces noursei]|nr:hypothetical protein GCM10010341_02590 [Streptomyces noursei]